MSLINGDEAYFCSVNHRNEAFVIEAFGRYITMNYQHTSLQASAPCLDLKAGGIKGTLDVLLSRKRNTAYLQQFQLVSPQSITSFQPSVTALR